MKFNKPKFWDNKKPNLFAYLLLPLTLVIFLINNIKKKSHTKIAKIKTICVGNIYIGGTGKTPISIMLNNIINNLNYKTAFIKKYYLDQVDEQNLLKKNGLLITGKNRLNALNDAVNNEVQIAIFDDGLQDRSLNYDISLVCFNINKWIGNGMLLPSGPLREKLNSLKKYNAVFLNGNGEDDTNIKNIIKKYNPTIKIFTSKYTLLKNPNLDKSFNYLVFSGIGNPESFIKTLKDNDYKIIKSLNFPDHYDYRLEDINKIKLEAKKNNAKIITTEKDYLRLNLKNVEEINYVKCELQVENKNELIKFVKESL